MNHALVLKKQSQKKRFITTLSALALIVSALSISNPVYSEPTVNTHFDFYDIYPSSKYDLGKEMTSRSPIKSNGKTFYGRTDWRVEWKFRWKKKNGLCKITSVSTFLDVKYTMPRIAKRSEVSQPIRSSFDRYYKALLNHEEGHMKSGLYAAREIQKELFNLGMYKSCERLEKVANNQGSEIIKKYNKRDLDYDKTTNHGKTEGAYIGNFI